MISQQQLASGCMLAVVAEAVLFEAASGLVCVLQASSEPKQMNSNDRMNKPQDETIHKKVFKVAGSIPAVNFIKVPKDKVLGLTGRFLYLQVGERTVSQHSEGSF